jgi:predicted Zn-dependent peptidase
MIEYKEHTLDNGLTLIVHRDKSTPLAAVNLIYRVGSKNESEHRTGFAHLFEHLMFSGSKHVPDFDVPIQMACGDNNAFTNADYTDYYMTLPTSNLETALWLESDRMQWLNINSHSLEVQRRVVIEEFNQRYLNQPYGDLWLLIRPMAYKRHPYRWSTIGMTPDHIANATLDEVSDFYDRFYSPENAILSIVADCDEQLVLDKVNKWFGDISRGKTAVTDIQQEPQQIEARRMTVTRDVPVSVVTIVYHMASRTSRKFHISDVISDLLSNGNSSRLYTRLVQQQRLCTSVNAYITGDQDPGLFVITGHVAQGHTPAEVEEALLAELEELKSVPVSDYELEKVKNKYETGATFGDINIMNKAMNLGFYSMMEDTDLINREVGIYRSVTAEEIMQTAKEMFRPQNSSTLLYLSENDAK